MKDYKTIDTYLQDVPQPQQTELQRIREFIKQTVPSAEETISYGMPTFKYKGKSLIHFAAFKDHLSIFPTSAPIAELKEQLADFATAKGTIHFTVEKPVPDNVIKQLLEVRIADIDK